MGIHSKPEKDREELHIKGPLKQGLTLYVSYHKIVSPSPPSGTLTCFCLPRLPRLTASTGYRNLIMSQMYGSLVASQHAISTEFPSIKEALIQYFVAGLFLWSYEPRRTLLLHPAVRQAPVHAQVPLGVCRVGAVFGSLWRRNAGML